MRISAPARPTRSVERKDETEPTRIRMLENDADEADRVHEMIFNKLDAIQRTLIALLVTISGGAVVGALNLLFHPFK